LLKGVPAVIAIRFKAGPAADHLTVRLPGG